MGLRYLTAGESHGSALSGILEGMPAGVELTQNDFDLLLQRRLSGYGRGGRSRIEADQVEVLSGVVGGKTIGSPIALMIRNADFVNHSRYMHPFNASVEDGRITVPLPGHADLAGTLKYDLDDCRPVRERASARETAMRTALSVPARKMLQFLGIGSTAFVESIGGVRSSIDYTEDPAKIAAAVLGNGDSFLTPDANIQNSWKNLIDQARSQNKTLGGTGVVVFYNLPAGLGSYTHHDRRLDGKLAALVMSIPAVKACGFGFNDIGSGAEDQASDGIFYSAGEGFKRTGNVAGGLEGGMTNGQPLIIRFYMKPLPANSSMDSVDLQTLASAKPQHYRSDVEALAAASITAESVVALQLASEILEVTGGDSLKTISERMVRLSESRRC